MRQEHLMAGRYRIEERISETKSSSVWRATDIQTLEPVAVKEKYDLRWREESQAEFHALPLPAHPNIVAARKVPEAPEAIVMDYVDGCSLEARLKRGPLPTEAVRRLGIQVLYALQAVHARGIEHGSLRPGKVLLEGRDPDRARVVGFGLEPALARVFVPVYIAPDLKRKVLYMPAYLSPPASDLFSLGLVLVEALSGQRAIADLNAAMSKEPPPLPPEVLESPLRSVLQKATQPRKGMGYATAEEMLHDLLSIDTSRSSPAPQSSHITAPITEGEPATRYREASPSPSGTIRPRTRS